MLTKNLVPLLIAALLIALSPIAKAATHCTETITRAILHLNGNIYFTSDKTCPNWCQVNWGTSEKNKNAFAMLLAAQTAARSITFYWPSVSECTEVNATYASPDYMMLN
jgi:redox-sensitive bicupin YhaK (pirin superfamily)